jgi:hypothetical protein
MTKDKALEAIKQMPQDFELDELIEKLIVIDKLDEGIRQVEEGHTVYHTDVKKKVEEWKKR